MVELAATAILGAAATAGGAWLRARNQRDRREAAIRAAQTRGLAAVEAEREAALAAARAGLEARQASIAAELAERDEAITAHEADLERLARSHSVEASALTERSEHIDAEYDALRERRSALKARRREVGALETQIIAETERAANATRDEILTTLREQMGNDASIAARRAAERYVDQTAASREQIARATMEMSCQRYGAPLAVNRLVNTVSLPKSAKLRARLQADGNALFEAITAATGVGFVQQDEHTFHLQGPEPYDPFRREIGRLTYERLVRGGTLTEAVVVKAAAKTAKDLENICRDAGKRAARILKIRGLHGEILFLVGKLLYRTSYTQNQWQHAIEAAQLCGMMAKDLGLDPVPARRAALIHDIGKVLYAETEAAGSHAVSGAHFARAHGEKDEIVHPIAAHHNDEAPSTALAHLVAAADALSGARPGARRETIESFSERVEGLERICSEFREVEKAFVIQGGREVRILVDPRRIDDVGALELAGDVAQRIEDECVYPGQIKVLVEREIRTQAVARHR